MTQVVKEDGKVVPVTAVYAEENEVTQLRTVEKDGYNAVQFGSGKKKEKEKGSPQSFRHIREVKTSELSELKKGDKLNVDQFEPGEKVNIEGVSKGKGFAGVMKRHNFRGMPASHGTKKKHRHPGAIGMHTHPGKVFKGHKMAGLMGNEKITLRRREVVAVYPDKKIILVKGAVPGAKNALLLIRKLA